MGNRCYSGAFCRDSGKENGKYYRGFRGQGLGFWGLGFRVQGWVLQIGGSGT